MTSYILIDLLIYAGLIVWIVGFVLRFIERRRMLLEHFPNEPPKKAPKQLDGIRRDEDQIPNSKRVTTLLIIGTALLVLAGALSWWLDAAPRAPEAAAEIEKLKEENNRDSGSNN